MNFRLTSGQTSGEKKISKIFLLAQKNRRQILGGLLEGRLNVRVHLLVEKPENVF